MNARLFQLKVACTALVTLALAARAVGALPDEDRSRLERLDAATRRAQNYLAARQSPDGAWRSDVYAQFKDGDALTPLVLMTLVEIPTGDGRARTVEQGIDYLVALVGKDGTVAPPQGLAYPVYTAAGAVMVLSKAGPRFEAPRDAWLAYLCERQLTEPLGWQDKDDSYGGWGYARELPRKPRPGEALGPLAEPNLSATVFALSALRAAGVHANRPEIQKALNFVRSCQNYRAHKRERDAKFDDGGFFFMHNDPVRNKAGSLGTDGQQARYASYGSATADGLRGFVICAMPHDDARLAAAWQWLARNFSAQTHPGLYAPARESARESVYYYYCHSLAELLADREAYTTTISVDKPRWAATIADELLKRQRPDGSWINTAVDVREDDPLVATAFALRALALCRRTLVVESRATTPTVRHDDSTRRSDSTSRCGR